MFDISGKNNLNEINNYIHSAMIDESYKMMGAHVDEGMRQKIQSFAYVDLARLLPRDRIIDEEDNRLTWIQKNGQPWLVPAVDVEGTSNTNGINSYSKWHIAFRIYSDSLTSKFPAKASELIQYEHIIYTASQTYAWQNVYLYDKDFRIHISKNPLRTWMVILQLAWNMRLKDRVSSDFNYVRGSNSSNKREPCRRFQRGKCNYGINCKFEHRCTICTKFGHGAYMCRKRFDNDKFDRNDTHEDRNDRRRKSDRYHYYKPDHKV